MSLAAGIPDGATVLLDTNPLIYHLEGSALAEPFAPIFAAIDEGRIQAAVTPITVAELVGGPLKAGKDALAERYRQLLTANAGWTLVPMDADIAMLAARLRLRYRLTLPDAIQVASALWHGCFALVSHNRDFGAITDLPVLGLARAT
jgi:predicted nucleic acid-binding protein